MNQFTSNLSLLCSDQVIQMDQKYLANHLEVMENNNSESENYSETDDMELEMEEVYV